MTPKPMETSGSSPLTSMLMNRAKMAGAPGRKAGPASRQSGAPMPLNAGGHAAPKYGNAPSAANC